MEISFEGKRALVTGAGKGIGRELCIALGKAKAKVVAVSRTQADLDSLKAQIAGLDTLCIDVSDWDATRTAVEALGPFDLLVNNAGISEPQSVLEASPEAFDRTFSINVKAAVNVSQVVAKGMMSRKSGGAIVNVSSQASFLAIKDHLYYCASKGALDQITRVMALELGPHKIRVNSVNPTAVLTDMGKRVWGDPSKSRILTDRTPLGRLAEVEEVVDPILFLLSDKASMITGTCLPIEGGMSIAV